MDQDDLESQRVCFLPSGPFDPTRLKIGEIGKNCEIAHFEF